MSAATLASPTVSEFAAAVRAALSDLSADEIDDLTDGLEADLTDRLADGAVAELGDPVAYAEELRTAAGLPHRAGATRAGAPSRPQVMDALRNAPREAAVAFREFGAAHPSLGRLRDFLVSLRPVWWLFRATVVTALIVNVLRPGWWTPINGLTIAVGIGVLVLSVQFGRGKWLPFAWMRGLLIAINVILILAVPFVFAGVVTAVNNGWYLQTYADESSSDLSRSGLMENGNQVSNIFAYDAQGQPLTDVQLYDQDGRPLDVSGDPTAPTLETGQDSILVPNQTVPGRLGWNVYPLGHVSADDLSDDGTIKHSVTPTPARLPFAAATPLAGSSSTAAPMPSPVATGTPTPAP